MSNQSTTSRGSRHGTSASSARGRAGGHVMSCNKCRKPLSTTVFVCACNCVFCEDCTYSHFQSSPNCPTCNRVLSENDFTELVVADPPSASAANRFQNMFTKQNPRSKALEFPDMCSNLMKQLDDVRDSSKLLLKQFIIESSKQKARLGQSTKLVENLRQENITLKQALNSQRMQSTQKVEKLRQQNQALQTKLVERDEQVQQFRRLHASNRSTPSPRNQGPRRVSGAGIPATPTHGPPEAPIRGFMIQREMQERANQKVLESPHSRRPIMGRHSNSSGNHQHSSHIEGFSRQHTQNQQHSDNSVGSGGIRNISSSSPFSFSGGQKRMRSSGSGGRSPSHAFLSNPSRSHSRGGQSPSSSFQHQAPSLRRY